MKARSLRLFGLSLLASMPILAGCSEGDEPRRGSPAVQSDVDEDGVAYSDEDGVDYAKDAIDVVGSSDGDPDLEDPNYVDEGTGDTDVDGPDLPGEDIDNGPADPFVDDGVAPVGDGLGAASADLHLLGRVDDGDRVSDTLSALSGDIGGVNGTNCQTSPYNCRFRATGGNRVKKNDSNPDVTFSNVQWEIDAGEVRDGNGSFIGTQNAGKLRFNYGQRRVFDIGNGVKKTHLLAMATSARSAGWFPLEKVKQGAKLEKKVGTATAHRAGLAPLGCYEIKSTLDPVLASKKVVFRTLSASGTVGEAAGDYLAKPRKDVVVNGQAVPRISANLLYGIPGVGGVANDHFSAGTKFRRVDVPRFNGGRPSLNVKLWTENDGTAQPELLTKEINDIKDRAERKRKVAELRAASKFTKRWKQDLKFVYGYVVTTPGQVRAGWIAYAALKSSTGCIDK